MNLNQLPLELANQPIDHAKDLLPYIDSAYKVIGQRQSTGGDMGDSCHRTASYWFLYILQNKDLGIPAALDVLKRRCMMDMNKFEVKWGVYCRHPDKNMWYSDHRNFSRDQTTMLMNALIVSGDTTALTFLLIRMISRFGFFQNFYKNWCWPGEKGCSPKIPDIITPMIISKFIRGLRLYPLYPLLYILDLFLFVDIFARNLAEKEAQKKNAHTDYDVMLAQDMLLIQFTYDTFVAKAARRLYSRSTNFMETIAWIFRPESNDPPVIAKLLISVWKKYNG